VNTDVARERPVPRSEGIRRFLQRMPTRNTTPEIQLRRELHRRGIRFRLTAPGLPCRPDLVLTRARICVFVHGCFWHGCERHAVAPKNNASFWATKMDANRARDARNIQDLEALGWETVIAWEHEAPEAAADRVELAWRRRTGRSARTAETPPPPSRSSSR
jgi:DNA mismatch endonuclease (patch repair protein)